jgi:hypothetical protein
MDDTEQQPSSYDDDIETQRLIVGQSLHEISNEVGIALRGADLNFPVGLATPHSGHAIVTMVTTVDPSNDEWEHASAIVRQIVSKRLGGIRLRSRHLPCSMANAPMNCTDITPNVLAFDTRS